MPSIITKENSIITFLPPAGRAFLEECSNFVDIETAGSWLLSFGIQQLQETWDKMEQKYLPDELAELIRATAECNGSLSVPPTATLVAKHIKGKRTVFHSQVESLSRAEIFVLTFRTLIKTLKTDETTGYLSPLEYSRQLLPPCSRQHICALCQRGVIPGAFKDPKTGLWRIPRSSLGLVDITPRPNYGLRAFNKEQIRLKYKRKGRID